MAQQNQPQQNQTTEIKTTRLPLFYGDTPGVRNEVTAQDLVQRIEAYCRSTNKPANTECQELYLTLRGAALGWWDSLKLSSIDKAIWVQLRKEFLEDFDFRVCEKSSYRLLSLRQKIGENVVTYYSRVTKAVDEMYEGMPTETDQDKLDARRETILHTCKNIFVSGLRENLRAAVLNHPIPTLKEAKEVAKKQEILLGTDRPKPTSSMWEELSAVMDTVLPPEDRGEEDDDFHEEEVMAINRWRANHRRRNVKWTPRRRTQNAGQPFMGKCHNCDKAGHFARNCREPKKIHSVDDKKNSTETENGKGAGNQQPGSQYSLSSIKNW
jgi:Retrotransposon gag protein/Zinc knuckle